MHRIFIGLALWVVLLFVAQFALGLALGSMVKPGQPPPPEAQTLFTIHMLGAIFLATLVCVVHIMTMFHFIGSGKEIKEAVETLGGDAEVVRKLREFKMRTSGWATLAPVVTGAATILGGGAHTGMVPSAVHWGLGLLAFLVNLWAFPAEYRALKANLEVIREVDERLRRQSLPSLPGREA
jgi:hypothetical protein